MPNPEVPETKEVCDVLAKDVVEHDHYTATVTSRCKTNDHRLLRGTHDPQCWRHKRRPMGSLCLYDAADDGVRIVKTGIKWCLDTLIFTVMMLVSLHWSPNSDAVPISIMIRHEKHDGQPVQWCHLFKIGIVRFFREATPLVTVHMKLVKTEERLVKQFLIKNVNSRNHDWM